MTVIDIRDEFYKRKIEIIEVTDDYIYYAELKSDGGVDSIYILEYSCEDEQERILAYFPFEDEDYFRHYYACDGSLIILFENGGSKAWIVKIDKESGEEVLRKCVPLVGSFAYCVPVDDDNLVIYTTADEETKGLFNRCLETTNSDTIANLYDIQKGYRYFIKDFNTANLMREGVHTFKDNKGNPHMIICEPYTDEKTKESFARQAPMDHTDARDNIWSISKRKFFKGVKTGEEELDLRRVASAGNDGMVRFECISGNNIIFRAKKFSTGEEKFCSMSISSGKVVPVGDIKRDGVSEYITDSKEGKIFSVSRAQNVYLLKGEVNSSAEISYPSNVGRLEFCIEDRFIVADKTERDGEPVMTIFDSRLKTLDTFQAHCKANGSTLVLF